MIKKSVIRHSSIRIRPPQHGMIWAGTLIRISLHYACMTTPQKVTKRRLVAYIEPDVYDYLEQFSLSNDCSISKSAEKMILQSIEKISEHPIQPQIKNDNIEFSIWEFLSHLPEEIIGKITYQIITSPLFHDQLQMIRVSPDHAGTEFRDDDGSVNHSNSQSKKILPEGNIDENIKEDVLISAYASTVRHSSHQDYFDTGMRNKNNELIQLQPLSLSDTTAIEHGDAFYLNTSDLQLNSPIGREDPSNSEDMESEIHQKMSSNSQKQERNELNISSISSETQTHRVAIQLKKYLEDNNISQRTFKQKYGIDITPIKSWIFGTRFISDKMALKIMKIVTQSNET